MNAGMVTLGETMALVSGAEVGSWAGHRDLKLSVAGAESNVAIGVRRLGHPASWISRVGADGFGELILRELRAESVSALATTDDVRPTGLMVKERPNSLRTHVRYYRGGSAAAGMTAADVDEQAVTSAAVLHVTGITPALGRGPAEAVRHAVRLARDAGVTVSLDVNYRSALWSRDDAGAALAPLVAQADVVFGGPEEASLLVDEADPERMARDLVSLGPGQAVVKLGADGAVSCIDGIVTSTPVVPVRVVDTVGAGDAFVAGYLAELMSGAESEQRLRTAAAAGAFACTALGDWEGLPTGADLRALVGGGDQVRR
ncbi:2-dehydro-3-deoxygluconokinase [Haloactinopolyspora alba]|uniref:2-dehydro-3-deoxygluconokinase n=1 Tax=Haloactinopolyspora alba TaxID=648780 RepID=A0A2P8E427_9ACTN|nr:sugar kinase [Haloactinopolyspora alba]PSL04201.1 2-dehydro-3-deoxygluconokinase [Haloactinopolyspora alba]